MPNRLLYDKTYLQYNVYRLFMGELLKRLLTTNQIKASNIGHSFFCSDLNDLFASFEQSFQYLLNYKFGNEKFLKNPPKCAFASLTRAYLED